MNKTVLKSEYMHHVFQYIESNLTDDIDTQLLSIVGYVSRDKLYSDFYSLSGHSVKEYVRKRRLSNALALIKASDMNLTDIAFQCGYASYLTLWRAVKQTLGITPSEYKDGATYYFFPPFNHKPLVTVTVIKESIPRMRCVLFYHKQLAGIENRAIKAFLDIFPNYDGRILGRNGKQKGGRFCYELYLTDMDIQTDKLTTNGFKVESETPRLHGRAGQRSLLSDQPGFTMLFAATTVQNNELEVNAAWDYLYAEWLQNSMFEYTGEPYYEEYIMKNNKPVKLKLYLPIRERIEDIKIKLVRKPGLRFIAAKANGHSAEEIASQRVMGYLTMHYPHIINFSKEIYLRKETNAYICGVRLYPEMEYGQLVNEDNVTCIATDANYYIILESSVMGDYDQYADTLLTFARDNDMDAEANGVFAVYDASGGFRNVKIRMYCKIRTK
jgi:AraC-like DNA-binding protein